ncbi:hypothetical protein GCQ56_20160 [Marinifilum sp. N1E240]|uniref:hypothetical protein n=1 Tax=Marinifilum sp. N1E240 TaxID=2608082 RepID=UPI00128BA86C|nr:hypothetical protein [Marinifilum sp. N1E240]MPQ49314.1 hypothetical protein [Marinifilum sp. N1E240]
MKTRLFLLPAFILLFSCTNSVNEKDNKIDFFPDDISGFQEERLVFEIKAGFSECGEWGGHKEKMFITARKDKEFYLKYELWCANCDSLIEHNDSLGTYTAPLMNLVDSSTIRLNNKHKEAVRKFTQDLVEAKFREIFPGHAGNSFEAYKYRGYGGTSLKIQVYGFDPRILSDYIALLKTLKLSQEEKNSCVKYYTIEEIESDE